MTVDPNPAALQTTKGNFIAFRLEATIRNQLSHCKSIFIICNELNFSNLQNLTKGADSSSTNPSELYSEEVADSSVTEPSLPSLTSGSSGKQSRSSALSDLLDTLGHQTPDEQDQGNAPMLQSPPIGSPLPSITEESGQPSSHTEARTQLDEDSLVIVSPGGTSTLDESTYFGLSPAGTSAVAVPEVRAAGSVVSETSLRILLEELDSQEGTSRSNGVQIGGPQPVDGGIFNMSDVSLDKTKDN